MTLAELQRDVRTQIFESPTFTRACASSREPTRGELDSCDALVAAGVHWISRNKPKLRDDRESAREQEQLERWMRRQARKGRITVSPAGQPVCGIGILLGALLSWAISRVIDCIWSWLRKSQQAVTLACAMAADLPQEYDDEE